MAVGVAPMTLGEERQQQRNPRGEQLIPWLELNIADDEAVNKMLEGLLEWRKITDTAIVSVAPGNAWFFRELKKPLPDMKIIAGLKTSPVFRRRPIDTVEDWKRVGEEIRALAEATGIKRVALENESATKAYVFKGAYKIDERKLREGLRHLPDDIEILWYPSAGGAGEVLERYLVICRALQAECNVRFIDHSSFYYKHSWGKPGTVHVADKLEEIARKPTLPMIYTCAGPRYEPDNLDEGIALAKGKWGPHTEIVIYTGATRWVEHGKKVAENRLGEEAARVRQERSRKGDENER
jgi:hypothetical protein